MKKMCQFSRKGRRQKMRLHFGGAWQTLYGAYILCSGRPIAPLNDASSEENQQILVIKNFCAGETGQKAKSAERQGMRPGGSYPLFLWITLCIRVRKRVRSERRRGFGMN